MVEHHRKLYGTRILMIQLLVFSWDVPQRPVMAIFVGIVGGCLTCNQPTIGIRDGDTTWDASWIWPSDASGIIKGGIHCTVNEL